MTIPSASRTVWNKNLSESLANARYPIDRGGDQHLKRNFARLRDPCDGSRLSSFLQLRTICSGDFATTLALLQHLAMMSGKIPTPQALMLVFRDWRDLK
jgi:hypothetical protein